MRKKKKFKRKLMKLMLKLRTS